MPSSRDTRRQRHQTQVKTQPGKAVRGAQATEYVKDSGYRKTEFVGGKKFYTAMSPDPTSSGAVAGDTTNITISGSVGGGGDIKSDGSIHFTSEQTGVNPTSDLHLATKAYVDTNATSFELTGDITGGTGGAANVTTTIATNAVENSMMADNAVSTAEIVNNSVTIAKLQQVGTDTFLGRNTNGTGNVEVITLDDLETMLQLNTYLSSASLNTLTDVTVGYSGVGAAATGHYLRYNGTNWVTSAFQATDISGLQASQIPALAASKITSSTFADARISESSVTQHSAAVKSSAGLMSSWKVREFDGTDNSVNDGEIVRFTSNNGGSHGYGSITGAGSTSDPFIVTLNTPNTTYTAGTNVSFNGVQINATNTNQLTRFYMRDDDNDAVYLAHDHYVKFASSGGITTNWSATDAAGSSGDPHVLTIGVGNITSVGTIGTGVWQGTRIDSSYLDTNVLVDNSNRTITGIFTFNGVRTDMHDVNINGGTGTMQNDAVLYVTASDSDHWGIKLSKQSLEYGMMIDVGPTSSHALRILGNGTEKLNINGAGVITEGTWNGEDIDATYIDSAIPRLTSTQSFTGTNTFTTRIKVGTEAAFTTGTNSDMSNCDLLVGGVNTNDSTAIAQFAGFIRVRGHVIMHDGSSSSNTVGWMYGNSGLKTYKEGSGTENVYAGGDVVAYYSSDPDLKKNKQVISKPFAKLRKLHGYTFDWKKKAKKLGNHLEGKDYGVMADEVKSVMPELVERRENGYRAVKYEKIVPLLIECIKEQQKDIDRLKRTRNKWI
jgi:hypothetical protein